MNHQHHHHHHHHHPYNPDASSVAFTTPPRGLVHAQRVRSDARKQYKNKGGGATDSGEKLRKRGLPPDVRYRRRLKQNQQCAAAARHSNLCYIAELERQAARYPQDVDRAVSVLQSVTAQRDAAEAALSRSRERHATVARQLEMLRTAAHAHVHADVKPAAAPQGPPPHAPPPAAPAADVNPLAHNSFLAR